MDKEELEQLKNRIKALEDYKSSKESQQIAYPLDAVSQSIINENMFVPTGKEGPFVLTDLMGYGLEINYNGINTVLYASVPVSECTAATSDIITSVGGQHNLVNTNRVIFGTTDTLPAPLSTVTIYYVISATATTFKVSLTSGGDAVDITDTGTGTHYFAKV